MIDSILSDIKTQMRLGNMVVKLIIINVGLFVFLALFKAFSQGFDFNFNNIISWVGVSSDPFKLLTRPWTILTHMFAHVSFGHILMNMLCLYWFGRIVGDLIGDRHILPLYILSGITGGLAFFIFSNVLALSGVSSFATSGIAYGASAAVAGLVIVSGLVAPNYQMNLLLIGRVSLKYVVAVIVFFYILGAFGSNSGGNIGHLGGVAFGVLYYSLLGKGTDLSTIFQRKKEKPTTSINKSSSTSIRKKSSLKVAYKKDPLKKTTMSVDAILDKIKKVGIEGISKEERAFLDKESKK